MTVTNQNQVQQKSMQDLRSTIMKHTDMLKMALPKTITPERMARIAMTAITRNPKLGACSQESFFGALLTAAQLGLEVNTPLGQAYLIPYNTKDAGLQCQFQLGYQGILELAYRSGSFKRIKAVVVHEGDEFYYAYGMNALLEHKPIGIGNPTHVYALYELTNGGFDLEVWTWEKIMQHGKTFSKSFSSSPWQTAPEEMAKKTVLKALLKYAPKAVELADATSADEGVVHKKIIHANGIAEIVTDVIYESAEDVGEKVLAAPENQGSEQQHKKRMVQQNEINKETEQELVDDLWENQQQAMYDSGPEFPM